MKQSMEYSQKILLVVEDSDEDFEALSRILKMLEFKHKILRCADGDEALDFIYHQGEYDDPVIFPTPSVILLDLNLPGTDGRQVLVEIKQDENHKKTPIIVFTTSNNVKDVEFCYQEGVNSYIIKPIGMEDFKNQVKNLINYWFNSVVLPE